MKTKNIITLIKHKLLFIRDNTSGFTLFEVLIGITVSSLILLMVYSSHNSITKAVTQLTGVADFYENLNLVIRRIDLDISCAYSDRDHNKICFIGESNFEQPFNGRIDFVTVDHKELSFLSDLKKSYPRSDVKEVSYFLKPDKKIHDLFFLVRREESHYDEDPESGGESNTILENVLDLKFEFRRGNNWVNNWDSRESRQFPSVIKATLKIRNYHKQEEEFVIIIKRNMSRS